VDEGGNREVGRCRIGNRGVGGGIRRRKCSSGRAWRR
jgi:hypothetical protein